MKFWIGGKDGELRRTVNPFSRVSVFESHPINHVLCITGLIGNGNRLKTCEFSVRIRGDAPSFTEDCALGAK